MACRIWSSSQKQVVTVLISIAADTSFPANTHTAGYTPAHVTVASVAIATYFFDSFIDKMCAFKGGQVSPA